MSTSINARGHSLAPWVAQTPATGMEVGGTMATHAAGVSQYTLQASRSAEDLALFDIQLDEWLEAGMVGYTEAVAEYKRSRGR